MRNPMKSWIGEMLVPQADADVPACHTMGHNGAVFSRRSRIFYFSNFLSLSLAPGINRNLIVYIFSIYY